MKEGDVSKKKFLYKRRLSKRKSTALFSIIYVLLVTALFLLIQRYDDYKLKTNLTAFQEREMKSTVNNFILIIDYMRKDMIENLERDNIPYTEESIKEATLTFIRHVIHESTFANGAYIWINEVVNFEGGDNYGIRQVHGNLPETEGMLLSTSMQDAKGNLPYLEELVGIREKGELTYKYYFKEYHSDNVSEKISYAKLYEPYNWIVCTGTYLNSMYNPTGGISSQNKILFYSLFTALITISAILFSYIIILNFLNSRKLLKETEILKDEVEKDSLTGAGSRSFGNALLQEYMNTFTSMGKNYTIAILDIDNFKNFNDCYGHNVGDAVMKNLVSTIKEQLNNEDYIIRWGGDEFILVLNKTDRDIDSLMRGLVKKVNEQVIYTEAGEKLHYTISIGASHFNDKDKTITDTIKRIDDALYLAKRTKNTFYIIG